MKECPACRHCFLDEYNNCPTDGEVLVFSIRGDTVLDGRYQLEWRLGQGGMGIVFKARHIFLKAPYAIKVILPDLVGNDPMLVTRFRQEAMLSARIRHRNIVNVTDFGVASGTMPYLVMDFIKGKSLQDLLAQEGRLSPARALEIMAAVCAGVGAAHQQDVVHRDLKPLNIMIQDDEPFSEGVKVLDFGLAKIKSGELLGSFVAAQSTGLMGSPFYMAPELWSDEEPDKSVDIYSMGVILFQIIAGDVPFSGNSIPAIMKKHLTDAPPSFSQFGVNVPQAIEGVVAHALAKKPQDRPASVAEFLRELRNAVATPSQSIPYPVTGDSSRAGAETYVSPESGGSSAFGQASWEHTLTNSQRGIEDEADRLKLEFEEAQRRADDARKRAEEAAVRRAEEEAARRRAEEEAARMQAEEEAARRRAEEAGRRQVEEEAARRLAEQEAARLRAEEEARKIAEEQAERIRVAEEAARLAREVVEAQERAAEARLRADEEARMRSEEAFARQRAEENARRLTQEVAEAQRRAEEARQRAEEEARRRAEDESARKQVEEQLADEVAEEAARKQAAEEVARRQAAEEADRLGHEVADARRRAEEAGQRAEVEARKRAEEEEARKRAEAEARRLAQEMAEVQQRAEEARQRVEAESRQRAEEESRKRAEAEEARSRAEEESRRLTQEIAAARAQDSGSGYAQVTADQSAAGAGAQSGAISAERTKPAMGLPSFGGGAEPASKTIWIILGVVLVLGIVLVGGGVGLYAAFFAHPEPTPTPTPTKGESPAPTPGSANMARVEGGTFQMGRNDVPMNSKPYDLSQYPERTVLVKPFLMDKTEVTNSEYAEFVKESSHQPPSNWSNGRPLAGQEKWPVSMVSYADANAFADWRSRRDGVRYRLPTEEEWEYAARNGAQDSFYPWGNDWLPDHANVGENGAGSPKPVGSYPKGASQLGGILDLIGNVWEWTNTEAAPYPGNTKLSQIPRGQFVIRGGSFLEPSNGAEAITATRRTWFDASKQDKGLGFRLVRDAK